MSGKAKLQRRVYVIDRDFQFRYLLTWLTMTMSLLGGMVLLTLVTFLFLRDTFVMRHFVELNAGLAVIITGISLFVMVRHSHRIAGPAHRLQRILKEIAAGTYDLSSEVRLRRRDYLKHVAEALNDLIEVRRVEKKHLGELVEWLGRLDEAVQTSQGSTLEIRALSARLRATADDIAGPPVPEEKPVEAPVAQGHEA
jgi:methyl-accepting chemotaxis protein